MKQKERKENGEGPGERRMLSAVLSSELLRGKRPKLHKLARVMKGCWLLRMVLL